jgi:hypothetical protein
MPLPGSPAIDAGDPNFTPPPFHDQRGACFHRVFGRRIDVGSVETQPGPRCPTPRPRPTPSSRPPLSQGKQSGRKDRIRRPLSRFSRGDVA